MEAWFLKLYMEHPKRGGEEVEFAAYKSPIRFREVCDDGKDPEEKHRMSTFRIDMKKG